MTDHSPDHAERARVEAIIRNEVGDACYDDIRWLSNREVVEQCVRAALRGRDRVVEDLTTALHDAISRPAGVVPASAEPFYDWRRYDRGPVRDAKVMREEGNG